MQTKRLLAVTGLLSAAALTLSACSGGGTPATSNSPVQSKAPGETVQIEYLHRLPDGEGMTTVEEIVAKWNAEHPDIQVKSTKFAGAANEMITKLEADVKAGTAPCLAQVGYGEAPELFVKGLLEDVTGEAEKYKEHYTGAYGQMSVGGKMVGLPQDTGPLVYLYNEAEFKALGLEVPKTSDELLAAAKTAAASGKYILDFEPDEMGYWFSAQAAAAGAKWFSAEGDNWVVNTTDAQSQAVAQFWQDALDSKAALTHARWTDAYDQAVVAGTLIGNIAPAWEVGFALDKLDGTPAEGQWRVALLPSFGGSAATGPDGGSGVAVMKGCAHIPEAMEFNDWFNTQLDDLATQGLMPAAKGTVATPEKTKRQFGDQDVFQVLAEANTQLVADWGYIPGYSAVHPKMTEKASDVVAGSAKVADILIVAKDSSVQALKDAGLPVAES
ncbi:MAG: extracellular solute-binding protein [Propionibacteriaceae bacterium]|nr:extracellular solute-binding protein [Propionibacteriaceae bacterium]